MKTNTTITHMLRFAAKFKVILACGHSLQCNAQAVEEQQWFIGKKVTCMQCKAGWEV